MPSTSSLRLPAARPFESTVSLPASVFTSRLSLRTFRVEDLDRRGQATLLHGCGVAVDVDRIVAVGSVDDDAVGLAVACDAAESSGEIDVHAADVSSRQVVDCHDVGTAECVEVDSLHARGVHRDVARVAEELEPLPVRRQSDVLDAVRAVEAHRVRTRLAFDGVAPVAGIPDECVGAGTEARTASLPPLPSIVSFPEPPSSVSAPLPPAIVSFPAPLPIVVGIAYGECAVRVVDANSVVASPGVDRDSGHRRAREAQVRDAVVADVDLENTGVAGFQAKRDLVAFAFVPLIESTPCLSCGCLNVAFG